MEKQNYNQKAGISIDPLYFGSMIGNTVHQLLICTFCCPLLTLVHVQCATKLEADWLQLNLSSLTIVSVELFSVLSSSSSTASPCPNIGAIPLREGVVGELLESQLPLWTWSLASVLTNIYVGPRKVRKIIFGIFFLMIVFVVSYALMWMIIYNHIRRLFIGSTTPQPNHSKSNPAGQQEAEEENYDNDDDDDDEEEEEEYEKIMSMINNRHFHNQPIKLENEKPNLLSSVSIPTLSEDYHQASSYSSSSLSISDSNEEILHGDGADDVQHVPNLLQKAKNNTCSTATINFSQSHSSPSLMYSY
ncbi:hypothetical protein T01_11394 [Trichinella spiralis]|uniref:Uncharacterized protein n=1 Tax=Trichinella spiralis TaxID=6334 RepID=A0A0V1B1A5_TRISP|nr:hypothetical protein T01_11394 [Trichinella spiralis]